MNSEESHSSRWKVVGNNKNFHANKERASIEGLFLAFFGWGLVVLTILIFSKKWFFPPLASDRDNIDKLYKIILITTGSVLVIVKFLWGFFIWKFSSKNIERASFWHHNTLLEVGWTVVTAIILSILVIRGINLWGQIYSPPPKNALVIEVVAQQFAWNFRFPGKDGKFGRRDPKLISDKSGNFIGLDKNDPWAQDDITTQDELYLPVNQPVVLKITSRDVIHSFFLPNFRVKQDAVPGMISEVWFTPKKTGEYEIACAELCGLNHYSMRGKLFVVEHEKFTKWLEEQK